MFCQKSWCHFWFWSQLWEANGLWRFDPVSFSCGQFIKSSLSSLPVTCRKLFTPCLLSQTLPYTLQYTVYTAILICWYESVLFVAAAACSKSHSSISPPSKRKTASPLCWPLFICFYGGIELIFKSCCLCYWHLRTFFLYIYLWSLKPSNFFLRFCLRIWNCWMFSTETEKF